LDPSKVVEMKEVLTSLCDKKIQLMWKGKFYQTVTRLTVFVIR